MKKSTLSLLVASLFASSIGFTQTGNWCKTDENLEELIQQNPAIIQQQQGFEDYILNFKQSYDPVAKKASIIIPMVFHVITNDGNGNATKSQIEQAVATINQDFKRLNMDTANTRAIFKPYAASLDIEFRLARLDPNGNCTEGITRTESPLSTNASDAVKSVSYWDSKKYFNVWIVDIIDGSSPPSYVAGYAQFPFSGINSTYGVVIDNQFLNGRTLTHEIGHCFNLYHTFQSGCGSNCSSSGDNCCDTPPVSTSSGTCDLTENTCSNDANGPDPYGTNVLDQIENYMSYNACQNMFSLDQKTRMMSTLNSTSTSTGLAQIWTPTNLAATGTADPYEQNPICVPLGADFTYNKEYICEGDQVSFADANTYNATPTQWDWQFTGGTPNASGLENPSITYNTAGVYGVSYSPGTSAGWATAAVKNNIITVSAINADYTIPVTEGFENTTSFNNEWIIDTESGNPWQNTTVASYSGSRSVRVLNYTNSINDYTELISPSYDLTALNNPFMEYKWAFARKTTGGNDQFLVYYSLDCGGTWTLKSAQAGASMATTATTTNGSWTPSGTGDWKTKTIDFSSLANESNVRFKFRFKNNGGNNFYLDDINIDGTVGITHQDKINNLKVYPNPMNESAVISFNLKNNVNNLNIVLRDVLGNEVTRIVNNQSFSAGKYTLAIDKEQKLSSGLYFIEFNADNSIQTEKLIVK